MGKDNNPFDDLESLRCPADDREGFRTGHGPPPRTRARKTHSTARVLVWPPRKPVTFTAIIDTWIDHLLTDPTAYVGIWKIAAVISRAAFKQQTLSPYLSNRGIGMSRFAKARALKRLQALGWIRVEQRPGQYPIVHIILKEE
jgi:hypothetical protein